MKAMPEEQGCSEELIVHGVLDMMLVLESGSLALLRVAAEGGGVREDIGLPFSSLIPGERCLQSVDDGEDVSAG